MQFWIENCTYSKVATLTGGEAAVTGNDVYQRHVV
jgi:hypothetical protein